MATKTSGHSKESFSPKAADLEHKKLKLKATDHGDLSIISSLLQDAIVTPHTMHYSPDQELFSVLANRFCWENDPIPHPDGDLHKRVHTSIHFSHVHDVKQKGIDQKDPTAVHSLIGILPDINSDKVRLVFADGAEMLLSFHELMCHVTDLSEHWYTPHRPEHGHEDEE